MKRRRFVTTAAATMGLALTPIRSHPVLAQPKFSAYPFSLGVASGDPWPYSVVLWTRLAPDPLEGITLPPVSIPVHWQIATDSQLKTVVAEGTAMAEPELAHAIHVVVDRLEPNQWYWYQFKAGAEISPIGRTRTTPLSSDAVDQLQFAFVSCQNYEHGHYTAYQHLALADLDLVFHLGDYIYEGKPQSGQPRQHLGPSATDLDSYRLRYALYKLDPHLQAAHAAFPFICTWDDHEVENDYAADLSQTFEDLTIFRRRRAAAYQAYYEHLPLRPSAQPQGAMMQLYRRFQFGDLAEFSVLDTRQYRDDQPCAKSSKGGGQIVMNCPDRLHLSRTMLGAQQEQWLLQGLKQSPSRWTVIAQAQLMAELEQIPGPGIAHWSDGWDGYAANRQRILQWIEQHRPSNPIVLSGDLHSFWVSDLKPDFQDPRSPVVATEFGGTSISSKGPSYRLLSLAIPGNPHIKFFDSRLRGYVHCTVTRDRWVSQLQVVDTVETPNASLRTLATFEVYDGQPGARRL